MTETPVKRGRPVGSATVDVNQDIDRLIEKRYCGKEEANAISNRWLLDETRRKRETREQNKRERCSYLQHLANQYRKRADELDHQRAQLLRVSTW